MAIWASSTTPSNAEAWTLASRLPVRTTTKPRTVSRQDSTGLNVCPTAPLHALAGSSPVTSTD